MNILFCGDIVGKSGREVILKNIQTLKKDYNIDFIIANGENATNGFGLSKTHAELLINAGINVITLGNHAFDSPTITKYLEKNSNVLRPSNYEIDYGKGFEIFTIADNFKIMVINLLGKVFMHSKINILDPFTTINKILENYKLSENVNAIIVDFHAETTSEKIAMGWYLNGRVSAVLGTHSHVPTADTRILNKGTAYQSDIGMCGDYNSVIGMTIESSLDRFLNTDKKQGFQVASEEGTLSAVLINIDKYRGLCNNIQRIMLGEKL